MKWKISNDKYANIKSNLSLKNIILYFLLIKKREFSKEKFILIKRLLFENERSQKKSNDIYCRCSIKMVMVQWI